MNKNFIKVPIILALLGLYSFAYAQNEFSTGNTKIIAQPNTEANAALASLNRSIKSAVESRLFDIQEAHFRGNDTLELITQKINEIKSLLSKYYALKPKKLGRFLIDTDKSENESFGYYSERTDIYLNNIIEAYSRSPVSVKERRNAIDKLVTLSCRSCHEAFAPNKYNEVSK